MKITMAEFIKNVSTPRAIPLEFVERNCRNAMSLSEDSSMIIGHKSERFIITLDSIKEYFGLKEKPKEEFPENFEIPDEFKDVIPADVPKNPPPPEKTNRGGKSK